jgi:hypothetical protein
VLPDKALLFLSACLLWAAHLLVCFCNGLCFKAVIRAGQWLNTLQLCSYHSKAQQQHMEELK